MVTTTAITIVRIKAQTAQQSHILELVFKLILALAHQNAGTM
jgi:hypothetical protein